MVTGKQEDFFSFNTPLKNKKFTISSNTNARFSDAVSYTSVGSSKNADQELSTTHNLGLGERFTSSYRSEVFDISLSGSVNYIWSEIVNKKIVIEKHSTTILEVIPM